VLDVMRRTSTPQGGHPIQHLRCGIIPDLTLVVCRDTAMTSTPRRDCLAAPRDCFVNATGDRSRTFRPSLTSGPPTITAPVGYPF
jgi:hypothetical protein